jgi:hypothetical protein
MEPPSYMRSVVSRNVVMRRLIVDSLPFIIRKFRCHIHKSCRHEESLPTRVTFPCHCLGIRHWTDKRSMTVLLIDCLVKIMRVLRALCDTAISIWHHAKFVCHFVSTAVDSITVCSEGATTCTCMQVRYS